MLRTLYRVAASGGPATAITNLQQTHHVSHRWPQLAPDGRVIFFALVGSEPSGIYVAPAGGGDAKRLVTTETAAAFAPPGYLLLVQQGVLIAQKVDLRNGTLGKAIPIAQPVATDPTIWRSAFSISSTGVLAHRATTAAERQLVWVDRKGARLSAVGAVDDSNQLNPSLSRNGRGIAIQRTGQGGPHTWIFDSGRDVPIRFRQATAPDGRAVWSPDGSRLIFLTIVGGKEGLLERSVSGGPADEKVLVLGQTGQNLTPLDWSSDGRFLLYSKPSEKTGWDIWALPLTGDQKPLPVVETPSSDEFGQFSPDGRWVAYQSNESGRTEVYIQPFMRSGGKISVSTSGGITPRWRGDGRELFYIASDGTVMAVPIRASADGKTVEPGGPSKLFSPAIVGGGTLIIGGAQQYCVSPDGQRFLINSAITEPGASPITVVLNWPAALRNKTD